MDNVDLETFDGQLLVWGLAFIIGLAIVCLTALTLGLCGAKW